MTDPAKLDEILPVKAVTRDGGSYAVRCPHCRQIVDIAGDDLTEIRGEQYQHKRRELGWPRGHTVGCDGWFEVTQRAVFFKELP